jgi:excisionase family DNA binding protein
MTSLLSPAPEEAVLYTPAEVAQRTKLGKTKVYELLATGELESLRIGTRRRIPHNALVRYIDSLRTQQAS